MIHKIERVKLIYDELSIKEIAYKMNYSSSSHLSNQFKSNRSHTNFSKQYFRRKGLEDL
jgi:AraC-like DNA-binding protein